MVRCQSISTKTLPKNITMDSPIQSYGTLIPFSPAYPTPSFPLESAVDANLLRPLFHYHPGEIHFDESAWTAYRKANHEFAEKIASIVEDGDLIWVQDYHLMVLPRLLRKAIGHTKKNVKIGFFLHTPFPSSEIYRYPSPTALYGASLPQVYCFTALCSKPFLRIKLIDRILPVRSEILEGVLPCDYIGFHTYDYARHFLSACNRVLNLPTMPNSVEYKKRTVNVGTIPIGIDPEKFTDVCPNSQTHTPPPPTFPPCQTQKKTKNEPSTLEPFPSASTRKSSLTYVPIPRHTPPPP